MIYILCLNPLTGELKVRVVGFVLKKLITYLNLLILPHFTLGTCSVLHCEWPHICYRSLWPIFDGPVILLCIADSIKYEVIILWILVQSDTVNDFILFGGPCDLYFMVQRFCLVSLTLSYRKTSYRSLKQTAVLTSCPWRTILVLHYILPCHNLIKDKLVLTTWKPQQRTKHSKLGWKKFPWLKWESNPGRRVNNPVLYHWAKESTPWRSCQRTDINL